MTRLLASALALFSIAAFADVGSVRQEIHQLLDQIYYTVDRGDLPESDLTAVKLNLQNTLDQVYHRPTGLVCLKQSTGRFYPARRDTGAVVGDDSYTAGHDKIEDCRSTLPARAGDLSCFKRSNGRYFPTNSETGRVVGSDSYNAGFDKLGECINSIN